MAYKKYIKRGDKIYGPYIYHSRRIGGKVISEYHGPGKLDYKKIFLVIFGVIFLVASISVLVFYEKEMTGRAVIEIEREIQGQVNADGTFNYTLLEGERAELKPRSVETDSGQLSDTDVELKTEGNEVIVTTTYSEINQSYSETNESLEEEIFPVVYFVLSILSEEESIEENITEPAPEPETPAPEITEEPASEPEIPESETTEEPKETEVYVPELVISLTEQERAVLIGEFGDTLKIKEYSPERGFIKVRFELGKYWREKNYDSNYSREILEFFIDIDKIKFLKDIANNLLEEPGPEEEFNETEISI